MKYNEIQKEFSYYFLRKEERKGEDSIEIFIRLLEDFIEDLRRLKKDDEIFSFYPYQDFLKGKFFSSFKKLISLILK